MRIGILTYQRAHNYGALLQAFALKSWVQTQGHDVEMIDYWPAYHRAEYEIIPHFKTRSFKSKIKAIVYLLLGINNLLKRRSGYQEFIQSRLNLPAQPVYTQKNELKSASYDLAIYGSDQIWRKQDLPLYKGFNEVYFGAIIDAKKISYAASMGEISLQQPGDNSFLKQNLKNFEQISVREQELQDVVAKLTGVKPALVLDPVFLLNKKQWLGLLPKPKTKERYIFLYQLKPSVDSVHLTNKLQKQFGCKVIEVLGRVDPLKIGSRYNQTASPFEFLSLIYNAEFVVSTSFHGTAFSILFEKQFFVLGMQNNAGRALSLLESLGIRDRYLENIDDADFGKVVCYEDVNEKLKNNIEHSISFLTEAICG